MKNIIIIISLIAAMLSTSCKKDELGVYQSKPSVNFVKSGYAPNISTDNIKLDTIPVSSGYYFGITEVSVKIPVRLSGVSHSADRTFIIAIVPEKGRGNIVEDVHYTVDKSPVMRAGRYDDSVVMKVNIAQLKSDKTEGLIVLQIIPNQTFGVGIEKYQTIGIHISGLGFMTQPEFWNRNQLSMYGGTYSKIKAEKYAELNNVTDDTWLVSDNQRYLCGKKTFLWFEQNPVDDKGNPTTAGANNQVHFKGTVNY